MDKNKEKIVRTRFAPSPTGFLHIGSARTALFNYLYAKKNNGRFILRIEDTDKERSKIEFEKEIISSLKWLGINWDEGPEKEGYRQSERGEIYKKYLKKLIEEKKAYYCFCSKEDLEAKKENQISAGIAPRYNGKCANISESEAKKKIDKGERCVIRLKMPSKKIKIKDMIRGEIEFDSVLIGDMVIAKNDFSPLYNFCVVVDDFEMKITHIIRGEDLLPNTPKQIILQEALNFPRLEYGHLPIILGPDRSKLSKRHGAVSLSEYKKEGYLKESIINNLALLGWNPGSERELFSLKELEKDFSIEKVHKAGAIFNIKKLDHLNGLYIRNKSLKEITELSIPYLIKENLISPIFEGKEAFNLTGILGKEFVQKYLINETGEKIEINYLMKTVSLYHERIKKISEITDLVDIFFKKDIEYDKELLKWKDMTGKDVQEVIKNLISLLSEIKENNWKKEEIEKRILPEAESFREGDRGYVLWPLRVSLTGKKFSAGPFEIAEILGKNKTIKRLKNE